MRQLFVRSGSRMVACSRSEKAGNPPTYQAEPASGGCRGGLARGVVCCHRVARSHCIGAGASYPSARLRVHAKDCISLKRWA